MSNCSSLQVFIHSPKVNPHQAGCRCGSAPKVSGAGITSKGFNSGKLPQACSSMAFYRKARTGRSQHRCGPRSLYLWDRRGYALSGVSDMQHKPCLHHGHTTTS